MQIVSFDIAKRLHDNGYHVKTESPWSHAFEGEKNPELVPSYEATVWDFDAPYMTEVVDWLREDLGVHVTVIYVNNEDGFYNHDSQYGYYFTVQAKGGGLIFHSESTGGRLFSDFDKCQSAGVEKALEMVVAKEVEG